MADMPSSSSPVATSSAGEASSVRPVACTLCRQRRSYCSKDRPKCSRCRDGGLDCVYPEARKITINEAYLRDLEARIKAYEETTPRSRTATITIPARIRPSAFDEDAEFEDEHPLLEPFTQLSVDSAGRASTRFKGPEHSDNFLRGVRKLSGIYGDDAGLDLNPNFYDPGALPSRRLTLRSSQVRLPPIEIARQLYAAQYTYIGTIFSFADPTSFEQLLADAYESTPDLADQESCLSYAKLLVILAFGKLYSINQWIDYNGPPGFDYFTSALQLLPDAHEEGSILFVEALALVGYFMQNMNRRDVAFLYIGMALRMAISLGLHQEISYQGLDEATREHRRRVWWSIYSLDRILCVKSGNPITIQDEDIGVAFPSKLPHEPEYCPAVVLRQYTKLSRILGEMTTSIYRRTPKSGQRLMEAVQNVVRALSQWHRELPDELRFDPARLSISRESVSTLLHYYQIINMTARPLLFHVVQKRLAKQGAGEKERDWKEGLTQTTIKVIEMCVSAAQDTINMMTIAAQKNLVATYGYMDSEHAFSAAIVLVMVCVAFPANAQNTYSMNAGLDLLRGLSQRGNSHMAARYELLAHLRSTFIPESIPAGDTSMNLFPTTPAVISSALSIAAGTTLSTSRAPRPRAESSTSSPGGAGKTTGAPTGWTVVNNGLHNSSLTDQRLTSMPEFQLLDNTALGEDIFYNVDVNSVTGNNDFWEEAFANPAGDAAYGLAQMGVYPEDRMMGGMGSGMGMSMGGGIGSMGGTGGMGDM